jgi:type I site-specific restriction endonuclease
MTSTARHQVHGGRRHLAELGLVAVLALATGCGGAESDQQTAAEAWADDVCSTVSDWKGAVEDAQTTLSDPANLSANDVKDSLASVSTATSAFVTDLKDITAPETEAGAAAQEQLSTLSDQLQQQADVVTRTLNQPSASLQELLAQVSTVSAALSTMVTDAVTAVENIRQLDGADELESAFQDSSTCQELRAGNGPSGG